MDYDAKKMRGETRTDAWKREIRRGIPSGALLWSRRRYVPDIRLVSDSREKRRAQDAARTLPFYSSGTAWDSHPIPN